MRYLILMLVGLTGCFPDINLGTCLDSCTAILLDCSQKGRTCLTECYNNATDEQQISCQLGCALEQMNCSRAGFQCQAECVKQAEDELEE